MTSSKATLTKIVTFVLAAYAAFFFGGNLGGRMAPWAYDVSGKAFAEYHKAIDFYMGARMPVVAISFMVVQLIFLVLEWKNRNSWPFRCVALGLALQLIVTVIAINTNVAMNAGMNAWNPDKLPDNWQAVRDEWLGGHDRNFFFNIAFSVLVFLGCYFYWTRSGGTKPQATK